MAGTHGGARRGAGRKPNAEKYEGRLAAASDALAAALPEVAEKLIERALGLGTRSKWMIAGLVTRKDVLRVPPDAPMPGDDEDGDDVPGGIWTDGKGKPVVVDTPIFPHLPPGKLVKVGEEPCEPDIRAIAELWARLGGKPGQEIPPDPARVDLEAALKRAILDAAARKLRRAGPAAPPGPPAGETDDPPAVAAGPAEQADDDDGL